MDYDTMRKAIAMRDELTGTIQAVDYPLVVTHARAIAEALILGGYIDLPTLAEYVTDPDEDDE